MNMITDRQIKALKLLNRGFKAAPELSDEQISVIQDLVKMGLARDFSSFVGHRIPIDLRIWGINQAGKAVLLQRDLAGLTAGRGRQLGLVMPPKPRRK